MDPLRGRVVANSGLFLPPFARPQSYMMAAAPSSDSKSLKGIIAGKKRCCHSKLFKITSMLEYRFAVHGKESVC